MDQEQAKKEVFELLSSPAGEALTHEEIFEILFEAGGGEEEILHPLAGLITETDVDSPVNWKKVLKAVKAKIDGH